MPVALIVLAVPALSWSKELPKQPPSSPPGVAGDLSEELPEMEEVTPAARAALRDAKAKVYGAWRTGFGVDYSLSYTPTVVKAVNSKTTAGGQAVEVSVIDPFLYFKGPAGARSMVWTLGVRLIKGNGATGPATITIINDIGTPTVLPPRSPVSVSIVGPYVSFEWFLNEPFHGTGPFAFYVPVRVGLDVISVKAQSRSWTGLGEPVSIGLGVKLFTKSSLVLGVSGIYNLSLFPANLEDKDLNSLPATGGSTTGSTTGLDFRAGLSFLF